MTEAAIRIPRLISKVKPIKKINSITVYLVTLECDHAIEMTPQQYSRNKTGRAICVECSANATARKAAMNA